MVSIADFTQMALGFEEAVEQPHFHKNSFRVRKKIFATLNERDENAVLKLSEQDQSILVDISNSAIRPVKGSWGKQGWTEVDLNAVDPGLLKTAMTTAYCTVAPKTLAVKYDKKV